MKRGWRNDLQTRCRHAATALLAVLVVIGSIMPVLAVQPDEILPDPVMERRARAITSELRCLVCQNQSIDDSDAPLARDLRLLVRDRLKAGDASDAVLAFVVSRYGDFVLLRPPLRATTILLWLGPIAIVGAGIIGLFFVRRRSAAAATAPLTSDEAHRLSLLLDGERP